jgi:hypothetical protein
MSVVGVGGSADSEQRVGAPAILLRAAQSAYGYRGAGKIDAGVASMIRRAASDHAKRALIEEKESKSKTSELSASGKVPGIQVKRWRPPSNPYDAN